MTNKYANMDGRETVECPRIGFTKHEHRPRVSSVRRWIAQFEKDKKWDSRLGESLSFIIEYCHENKIPYELKAYPIGYHLEVIPPLQLGL